MRHPTFRSKQTGAVLIVSLMFLVILTMLGVTAMTATTFEERMAGNARDSAIAFQAAEAALRDARRDINFQPVISSFSKAKERNDSMHESAFGKPVGLGDVGQCNDGRCRPRFYQTHIGAPLPPIPVVSFLKGSTQSVEYGTYTGASSSLIKPLSLAQQPQYIIELFCLQTQEASIEGQNSMCKFYRLTARGYGNNPNTQVTLQEVFLKL